MVLPPLRHGDDVHESVVLPLLPLVLLVRRRLQPVVVPADVHLQVVVVAVCVLNLNTSG